MPKLFEDLQIVINSMGGQSALESVLKDFYRRMAKDTMIGYFFTGRDPDEIAIKQAAFILSAAQMTKLYTGKSPSAAHLGLPDIRAGHFDRRLIILESVLSDHKVPSDHIQIWLKFEQAFRSVVQKT